jgi:hypothetical protein
VGYFSLSEGGRVQGYAGGARRGGAINCLMKPPGLFTISQILREVKPGEKPGAKSKRQEKAKPFSRRNHRFSETRY